MCAVWDIVINDLNKIMVIRNTIGTIKEIIKFYRESTLRRNLIPNKYHFFAKPAGLQSIRVLGYFLKILLL